MATAVVAWIAVGLTAVSTVVGLRQQSKLKKQANSYTYGEGALTTSTSNTTPLPIIYGKVRVAGNQIYSRLTNKKKTLSKLVAIADGPIQSISNFKIDDKEWDSKDYKNVSWTPYYGTSSQSIDSRVEGNTQEEKAEKVGGLKHLAYIAIQADANKNLSGAFSVSMDVEGSIVKVYSSSGAYELQYSNNPAWCILDFMTRYNGCGMSMDEIDLQSFIDAAKYFDENDYTLNLCLDTQKSRLEWIMYMMNCCRSMLVYKAGKYSILVEKAEEVSQTFTPETINNLNIWFSPLAEVPDIYRVTYISPENEWSKVQAEASLSPTKYLRKQPLIEELELMGVTNFSQASRLAWFYLNQALSCQTYVEFTTDQRALNRTVGDIIELTDYVAEFEKKKFRIIKIEDSKDEYIKLTCREYNEDIYNEQQGESAPIINITKIQPNFETPSNIIYVSNTQEYYTADDGTVFSNVYLKVNYDASTYASYYKVDYKKIGESFWSPVGNFEIDSYDVKVPNMEVFETYQFRFQSVSMNGRVSEFTYSPNIYIQGDTTIPTPPPMLIATRTFGGIKLSWNPVQGAKYYKVYSILNGKETLLDDTSDTFYVHYTQAGSYTFGVKTVNNFDTLSTSSKVSIAIVRPKVTNIKATNRYREAVDGVARYDIHLSWTPPTEAYYKKSEVWYKTSNEQAEYLKIQEGVPADEMNFYTGDWMYGGYGANSLVIPQAVVGDRYKIAICALDEYGESDPQDLCPQIIHEVVVKSAIPNTPDNLSISFGEKSKVSWDVVENSDILFYEVRTNTDVGKEVGMLAQTSENNIEVDLFTRKGTIYVYAYSTSSKYSSPAKLTYNKVRPYAPVIRAEVGNLGQINLINSAIPQDCHSIHYELAGIKSYSQDFKGVNNLIGVEAGIYDIKACYVDAFGQGEFCENISCVVEPWIDGALIKKESITESLLDSATKDKLSLASSAVQTPELTERVELALDQAKNYTDDILQGALEGALDESFDRALEEALERLDLSDLKAYVKVEELDDGVKTSMAKIGLLNDEKVLNVYTKSETAEEVKTILASKNLTDSSGKTNVYTKSETPEQVQTVLASKSLTDSKGVRNVYTKTESDNKITESLTSYTTDVLSTQLASYATTKSVSDLSSTVSSNLAVSKTYAETQSSSALADAKAYAESQASSSLNSAKTYAESQASSSLNSAKTYAESQASGALNSAKTYAEGVGKTAEENANAYADGVGDSTLTKANNYSDTQDASVLNAAKEDASTKASQAEKNAKDALNSYKTTVSSTYATNTKVDDLSSTVESNQTLLEEVQSDLTGYKSTVANTYATKSSVTSLGSTVTSVQTYAEKVNSDLSGYKTEVLNTYATKSTVDSQGVNITSLQNAVGKDDKGNLKSVSSQISTALSTAEGYTNTAISKYNTDTVSKTYATIASLNSTSSSLTSLLNSYTKGDGYLIPAETHQGSRASVSVGGTLTKSTSTAYWTARYDVGAGEVYNVILQLTNSAFRHIVYTDSNNKVIALEGGVFYASTASTIYDVAEGFVTIPKGVTRMWITSRANTTNVQQACSACIKVRKAGQTYSSITQLDNAIGLKVSSTDFNGNNIISKINLGDGTVTIGGKYIHISGDTVFDNNVTVKGTWSGNAISAEKLSVTSLSSLCATIGTLRTKTSGARTEIKDNLIEVYDSNNNVRVRLGVW